VAPGAEADPALVLADTRANADDEAAARRADETIRLLREDGFDAFWEASRRSSFAAAFPRRSSGGHGTIAAEQPSRTWSPTVEALRDRP
jgi:hypothetical protein